jgi:hypothetical protein
MQPNSFIFETNSGTSVREELCVIDILEPQVAVGFSHSLALFYEVKPESKYIPYRVQFVTLNRWKPRAVLL